jgi:unsaturated rhamnogalacturonyl hydrolase
MKHKNYIPGLLLLLVLFSSSCFPQKNTAPVLAADSFIRMHPDTIAYKTEAKSYNWNYEQGLIMEAFYQLWQKTGDRKYQDYIIKNINYYIKNDGSIKTYKPEDYNLDNIAPGRQLLNLYDLSRSSSGTGENKYKRAADILFNQLQNQPRTATGGFWHKKIYPDQMWLDGLYMAQPFYTYYAVLFNNDEVFDDAAEQFRLIRQNHFDEESGLYYHGWDESRKEKWADPEKGTSPNFWGRSIGWFMMAMVDVLDYFPKDHTGYMEIMNMYKELSENIIKYRDDDTKLWFQIIDMPEEEGNYIEASASLMFIYSLAKGADKGYLDNDYYEIAQESFDAVYEYLITTDGEGNILLNNVCSVGGLGGKPYRDGSFGYYISEPIRVNDFKGYGPLILAGIQFMKSESGKNNYE